MLQRKVNKVLTTRIDSPDLILALNGLSEFYGENTLANRRKLRSNIERRGLDINKSLITAFKQVEQELKIVENSISSLDSECKHIEGRLNTARSNTEHLMEKTERLTSQRDQLKSRRHIVDNFLTRFHLTEEQIAVLESETINEQFFQVLDRIVEIRADCRNLLQSNHQRAGLDIIDRMTRRLEDGYEQVYRWVQRQSRQLETPLVAGEEGDGEEHRTHVATLSKALRILKNRPAYYDHCFQEISSTRRIYLVRRFIDALTRGGPNGMPKPIEIHAHDPARYTSDMLAWVHQAVANEREFGYTLFASEEDAKLVEKGPQSDPASVTQYLDKAFEGIARPLEVRVQHALLTQPGIVLSYQLGNILDFYSQTISPLLSEKSKFRNILEQLRSDASKNFYSLVQEKSDGLVSSPPPYTFDLSPPHVVKESISQLLEIMEMYQSSLVPHEVRDLDFAPVLSAIIDPLCEAVDRSCESLDPSDTAVYHVNCLTAIQAALIYSFTQTRYETLSLAITKNMESLISCQTSIILKKCGIAETLTLIEKYSRTNQTDLKTEKASSDRAKTEKPKTNPNDEDDLPPLEHREDHDLPPLESSKGKPLSECPGLETQAMATSISTFCAYLFSLGALIIPQCERLGNPQHREAAHQGVGKAILQAYLKVYGVIHESANKYDNPQRIVKRHPHEVKALLGV